MPSLTVLRTLLREYTTFSQIPRIPEPDLVMANPTNVEAYTRAGTVDRTLAPVYLHNAAHIAEIVAPGDRVLDLGCGPATQLSEVATLCTDASFIGIDLSAGMLESGRGLLKELRVHNVELRQGDITRLEFLADQSIDAVISTLTFHHLPDVEALDRTFSEIARVLRPGGGVFLLDFGRLRSQRSVDSFAYQYADRQPQAFTEDYWHSLRAAFSLDDFRNAGRSLAHAARLHSTFSVPYMLAFKSAPRHQQGGQLSAVLGKRRNALPLHHQQDLRDLKMFFSLGGLRTKLL